MGNILHEKRNLAREKNDHRGYANFGRSRRGTANLINFHTQLIFGQQQKNYVAFWLCFAL